MSWLSWSNNHLNQINDLFSLWICNSLVFISHIKVMSLLLSLIYCSSKSEKVMKTHRHVSYVEVWYHPYIPKLYAWADWVGVIIISIRSMICVFLWIWAFSCIDLSHESGIFVTFVNLLLIQKWKGYENTSSCFICGGVILSIYSHKLYLWVNWVGVIIISIRWMIHHSRNSLSTLFIRGILLGS